MKIIATICSSALYASIGFREFSSFGLVIISGLGNDFTFGYNFLAKEHYLYLEIELGH